MKKCLCLLLLLALLTGCRREEPERTPYLLYLDRKSVV